MHKDSSSGSKVEEYVQKFGTVNRFFEKILSSLEFPFSIINVDSFETEISNIDGFNLGMKCHKLYYNKEEKCKDCPIDSVIENKDKVHIETDAEDIFLIPIFGQGRRVVSVINYKIKKKERVKEEIVERINRKYEENFYNILQNSQDVVYRYDFITGAFEYVSESIFTIMGFPLSEFVSMRYDDFLQRIHPEDKEEASKFTNNDGEGSWEGEYRWKCKNGKYKWFLDKRAWFFDEKGRMLCLVGNIKDISAEKEKEEDKRILEERLNLIKKQRGDNEKVNLTDKEKLVLWGLCRWSLLNDEELSEKLELKRSTLTAIKNRLKKKGWFSLQYIPNFAKLGCQFAGIFSGSTGNANKLKLDFLKNVPEVILNNCQNEKFFGVFVSDKYVAFKKFLTDFEEENSEILKINKNSFFYDMEDFKLKDFSDIVNSSFGLKKKEVSVVYDFENAASENDLNINERRVLHAMIKYPDISSAEIAKKVWISKPTVIKIKNKLIEENFVYAMIIPNFKKLKLDYFALFNYEFDPELSSDIRRREEIPRTVLKIEGRKRIVKFVLFASEEEYLTEVNLIKNAYHKNGAYFKLNSDIFPIQKRGKNNFNVEPFLNELLFRDVT